MDKTLIFMTLVVLLIALGESRPTVKIDAVNNAIAPIMKHLYDEGYEVNISGFLSFDYAIVSFAMFCMPMYVLQIDSLSK